MKHLAGTAAEAERTLSWGEGLDVSVLMGMAVLCFVRCVGL